MGFKDLLTKKPAAAVSDLDALKGQAYDSTAAAEAPLKGNFPVAGNGPNTLEHLQRVAKSRSHSHLKSSLSPSATSPVFSRIQGQLSKRPSTSSVFSSFSPFHHRPQSSRSAGPATPRSTGDAISSPTTPTGGRKYGPYRIYKDDDAPPSGGTPPVPHIPDYYSRKGSIDSTSMLSASTHRTKGYVDLLDAQSEFKPSDFYTRVKATGTRNYGEDVAERNLRESNANYAVSPGVNQPNGASRRPPNRVSVIREDTREAQYSPPTPEYLARDAVTERRRSGRDFDQERFSEHRKSFGEISASSKRRSKPKDLDLNLAVSNFGVRPSASMPSVRPSERVFAVDDDEEDDDEQTPKQATSTVSSAKKNQDPPRRSRSAVGTRTAALKNAGKQHPHHLVPPLPTQNPGEIGFIQSEAGQTDSDDPDEQSTSPAPSPVVSRHSEQGFPNYSRSQRSYKSSLRSQSRPSTSSSYATQPRAKPLGENTLQAVLDDIVENIPARTSSLATWPLRPESPPTTVSSIQSSNALSPPRSHHTASTSIDGGRTPSVKNDGHTYTKGRGAATSTYSAAHDDARQQQQPRARQLPKDTQSKRDTVDSQTSALTEDLNTTDGSDVDAYVAKRRQRKRDKKQEEEMVQTESQFGDIGRDLPGLFGNAGAAAGGQQRHRWEDDVPETPRVPARFATTELEALFAARFNHEVMIPSSPYSDRLTRAFLDKVAAASTSSRSDARRDDDDSDSQSEYSQDEELDEDEEEEDDEDDDDEEEEDGAARRDSGRERAVRLLAAMKAQGLNVMDLVDLEESLQQRQERRDIRTAMRLRKEMKKMERVDRLRSGKKVERANGGGAARGVGYAS